MFETLNWDCSTSAILGLTVLALGNCVADWVADTLVARAGKPEMAFASCFGSPLLSHVIGLSVAMIVSYCSCHVVAVVAVVVVVVVVVVGVGGGGGGGCCCCFLFVCLFV